MPSDAVGGRHALELKKRYPFLPPNVSIRFCSLYRLVPHLFIFHLEKKGMCFCCFVPFFIDVQVLFFNLVEFIHFPPVPLIHLIGFFAGFNLKEVQWFVFFSFSLTPSPSYSILVVLLADSALF